MGFRHASLPIHGGTVPPRKHRHRTRPRDARQLHAASAACRCANWHEPDPARSRSAVRAMLDGVMADAEIAETLVDTCRARRDGCGSRGRGHRDARADAADFRACRGNRRLRHRRRWPAQPERFDRRRAGGRSLRGAGGQARQPRCLQPGRGRGYAGSAGPQSRPRERTGRSDPARSRHRLPVRPGAPPRAGPDRTDPQGAGAADDFQPLRAAGQSRRGDPATGRRGAPVAARALP